MNIPTCSKSDRSNGFTLIELLVVIAIIGILSSVLIVSLNSAREKARISKTVVELREMQKLLHLYYLDTNRVPPDCVSTCRANTDPYLNSLSIPGWHGPYARIYDRSHPWGGHIGITTYDKDGDSLRDCGILLNDDRPLTNEGDDGGLVPVSALLAIDRIIDDGNLSTGNAQGNGANFGYPLYSTGPGELMWKCDF